MKEDYDVHWQNMPEFTQEKQTPYACVNIRFETEEDLAEFMRITKLRLTKKSKSAWFPDKEASNVGILRWM